MFTQFSNVFDTLLSMQNSLEAAHRCNYSNFRNLGRGAYPAVDIFQDGDTVVLTAEIPGVKKEDIHLEVKDRSFRLFGERKATFPEQSEVHRAERRHATFDRTLRLPHRVEAEKVTAEYVNGILRVIMPRAESDKAQQIKVA